MYCSRPVARSPSVVRIVRPAAKCGRQASFLSQPFLHRFPGSAVAASNDFAPFFRLFDDLTSSTFPHIRHNAVAYQPRFDVREVGETYELRGELPGVEGKDIEVEFTDPQTLVVRGRTEKETSSGTPPVVESAEAETTKAVADGDNSDAASTYSTGSYQKPSVEDDAGEQATPATPAESTAEKEPEPTKAPAEEQQTQTRYWVSERSTGSFQRVFNFPSRVDTDSVKASLKNGILSIVVPKAAAPAAKKIDIE